MLEAFNVIHNPEYVIIGLKQTESTLKKPSLQLSWMLVQIYKAICEVQERNKELEREAKRC